MGRKKIKVKSTLEKLRVTWDYMKNIYEFPWSFSIRILSVLWDLMRIGMAEMIETGCELILA